jgi:hypothetical protein
MPSNLTPEQVAAYRTHMESVLNAVYESESGREYLMFLMSYCKYWMPTDVLIKGGFKEGEILTLNAVVKNCVFAYLKPEYTAQLIKKTKERQNGRK